MSVLENCWPHCLAELERRLGADQFRIWIKPLTVEMTDEGLNLIVPNQIFLQFIRDRYLGMIEEAAAAVAEGDPPVISLRVGTRPAAIPQASNNAPAGQPVVAKPVISVSAANHETTRLNPNFTFETLVTGKANQLARAAAIQVAENPGVSYNPLFVYGGVGLGKTHLIQSIGNYVHQRNPGAKIRYIHAEKYVQDVVRAYQHKAFDEFKRYYHSLDLLLIDDIQFFVGKDKTQEEFFYAFNALVEAHKQIIITSDRYPKEIDGLQERLTSRFSWG